MTRKEINPTVEQIKHIGDSARLAFIDREELIRSIELALVSGQHLIVLGPPGTGKSRLIRYFSQALSLPFFRKLLNPDLPREDIVGPIDPIKLQQGKWDRAWLGIATCPIVFMDEIGKASAQVMNMLLDAMEERKASCGDNEIDIPLHTLVSASNETIASESPAMWNRFTLRVVVHRITEVRDFERLISDAWKTDHPPSVPIDADELHKLRVRCVEMAAEAHNNTALKRALIKMFSDFNSVGSVSPTPRQWLNVLITAAANALLNSRDTVITADLEVAGLILWDDVEEIDEVQAFVSGICRQDDREYSAAATVLENMTTALNEMGRNDLEGLGTLKFRVDRLVEQIVEKVSETGEAKWEELKDEALTISMEVEQKGKSLAEPIF